jgi:hypothetical protein
MRTQSSELLILMPDFYVDASTGACFLFDLRLSLSLNSEKSRHTNASRIYLATFYRVRKQCTEYRREFQPGSMIAVIDQLLLDAPTVGTPHELLIAACSLTADPDSLEVL